MLEGYGFADLLIFGADPGIALVAVGMQVGQRAETLLVLAMVDEPSCEILVFAEHRFARRNRGMLTSEIPGRT